MFETTQATGGNLLIDRACECRRANADAHLTRVPGKLLFSTKLTTNTRTSTFLDVFGVLLLIFLGCTNITNMQVLAHSTRELRKKVIDDD